MEKTREVIKKLKKQGISIERLRYIAGGVSSKVMNKILNDEPITPRMEMIVQENIRNYFDDTYSAFIDK